MIRWVIKGEKYKVIDTIYRIEKTNTKFLLEEDMYMTENEILDNIQEVNSEPSNYGSIMQLQHLESNGTLYKVVDEGAIVIPFESGKTEDVSFRILNEQQSELYLDRYWISVYKAKQVKHK